MEKKLVNEMETGGINWLDRDPNIQITPTLDPKVCRFYLHWAIWIPSIWTSTKSSLLCFFSVRSFKGRGAITWPTFNVSSLSLKNAASFRASSYQTPTF